MVEKNTTFRREFAIRDAHYDIGTYEGYFMSRTQKVEKQIRLNENVEPLNPKNLRFEDWLKEERSKKVSFLTKNDLDMPIMAEIFGFTDEYIAPYMNQI